MVAFQGKVLGKVLWHGRLAGKVLWHCRLAVRRARRVLCHLWYLDVIGITGTVLFGICRHSWHFSFVAVASSLVQADGAGADEEEEAQQDSSGHTHCSTNDYS